MMRRGDKVNKKSAELCTAAVAGQVETLQRASKSALNRASDDDVMTPAMCAAAHGQLAALRVIVERGFVSATLLSADPSLLRDVSLYRQGRI